MSELRTLAEEVPDLKAQINKLEKAALSNLGAQDEDSPFATYSKAKISTSMNYMTALLVKKEAEITQLQQTISNMNKSQAKTDDEIGYLINIIKDQNEKIKTLTAKNEKTYEKSLSEITYLMDYINKQSAQIKSL